MQKEEARKKVAELVEKYGRYEAEGKLRGLSEQDTKAIFVEPLFEALGWNMKDLEEVSREKQVLRGRADYAFRLSGVVRFFLEAKAADAPLGEKEAWQAINYAYLKSVSWAVLTNFGKLIIYSSEWRAARAEESRFLQFSAGEFVSRFDELWLLGKESISSGEIERYAERVGRRAKRESVTRALFRDFMDWRSRLSKSIDKYDRGRKISKEEKDEAIQKFLNRLIFIRACEDRGLENERLRATVREWKREGKRRLMSHVRDIFEEYNIDYDSSIFAPHMASGLVVDDEVLAGIITGLYENPDGVRYDFNDIDPDVLGNIYEQYLATILRAGGGVLERDAKRKEMGIYYTPTYIVDYIVKNTLGELLKKAKSPGELEKIRVLDPACGSGSFLIRAYEMLSDAYRKANGGDQEMLGENVSRNAYTILTKNLYGVDLDNKAVEIAELNLLLRAAKRKGLLPPLSDNIKRGNSLISGSEEELKKYFGEHWRAKHPFNWEQEFPDAMREGGFDVVVGNPPWVRAKIACDAHELDYLNAKFREYSVGELNLYKLFVVEAIKKLKKNGLFAFIIPSSYLSDRDSIELRKWLLTNYRIVSILLFSEKATKEIFEGAITQATTILVVKNTAPASENLIRISPVIGQYSDFRLNNHHFYEVEQKMFLDFPDAQILAGKTPKEMELIKKLLRAQKLENAIETKDGEIHITKYADFITDTDATQTALLVRGSHLSEYYIDLNEKERAGGWLKLRGLSVPQSMVKSPRILVQRVSNMAQRKRIKGGIIGPGIYAGNSCVSVFSARQNLPLEYLLGILHSSLLNWYFKAFSSTNNVTGRELKNLPFVMPTEESKQRIIKLVDRMLALNRRLVEMGDRQTSERQQLEAEIARTDREIDELVYKLYGITEEEKKIIEESLK